MADQYHATIKDGRDIFIPSWNITVSLENLTKAGNYLGIQNVITMADLNINSVIVAIMEAKDAEQTANLVKHFVCQVRIDGSKIDPKDIDNMFEGELHIIAELFMHVICAQYKRFFDLGLVKVPSQKGTQTPQTGQS